MRAVRRRVVVRVGAVLAAGVTAATLASPSAGAATAIKWGADVHATAKQQPMAAIQALQTKVGRTLGATRDFLSWDSPFPTAYETALKAQGTTILLSVATNTLAKTPLQWGDIAAAQPGSALYAQMVSWADRVRDFGAPTYVTMNHEPETVKNGSEGTAPQYIAAWQNWVSVFRAEGATNVKFLWISTANAFRVATTDRRYGPKWYPGDAWVDAIGTDAYNYFTCRPGINTPWRTLQWLIEGARQFLLQHPGKEGWIPEFGSVADPANAARRAGWITEARALFQQPGYERYAGVLYFDIVGTCQTKIDADAQAVAAFAAMGQDPYYAG
jgi:hypothetical protein